MSRNRSVICRNLSCVEGNIYNTLTTINNRNDYVVPSSASSQNTERNSPMIRFTEIVDG